MRHLLQPKVLNLACLASLVSTAASYPRLHLWLQRPDSIGYLLALIFISSVVLWSFVIAWHGPYTNRPVLMLNQEAGPVLVATLAGMAMALIFHVWVDPSLRPQFPEDYPADPEHFLATLPFLLGFQQLFLIFAPFDWLVRLVKQRWVAAGLLGIFSAALLLLKVHQLHAVIAPGLLAALLAGRVASAFLVVALYLRGGVILVSWWTLWLYARHLLDLLAIPR